MAFYRYLDKEEPSSQESIISSDKSQENQDPVSSTKSQNNQAPISSTKSQNNQEPVSSTKRILVTANFGKDATELPLKCKVKKILLSNLPENQVNETLILAGCGVMVLECE